MSEDAEENPTEPQVRGRGRPMVVVRLFGWVIVAGLSVAFVGLWVGEMVTPTTHQSAVTHDFYCRCAQTGNGRILDISTYGGLSSLVPNGPWYQSAGEPIVVYRSELTGRVTGARNAHEFHDFRTRVGLVFLIFSVVVAVAATFMMWWRLRGVRVSVRLVVLVIAIPLAVVCSSALLMLPGPHSTNAWPVPDSMDPYRNGTFPARVVPAGQVVEADNDVTLQVAGRPTLGPPAGSPGWLHDFDVMVIPVKTAYYGDLPTYYDRGRRSMEDHYTTYGHHQIMLLGTGRGITRTVRTPPCDAAVRAFESIPTPPAIRPLCFLVPPGFRPRYLVIDTKTATTTSETAQTMHLDDVAIPLAPLPR